MRPNDTEFRLKIHHVRSCDRTPWPVLVQERNTFECEVGNGSSIKLSLLQVELSALHQG